MNPQKISYFENPQSHTHREFIMAQNNCVLCQTVLELKHLTDNESSEITEEAFCPECEVKTRNRVHSLQ